MRIMVLSLLLIAICPALVAKPIDSVDANASLVFSCVDKPFVSVAARAPHHDSFPAVELLLRDGLGRSAGYESGGNRIPDSSYGDIFEMRQRPMQSKARAVEVCNAEQGVYEVEVHELSNERYSLVARGEKGKTVNSDFAILKHVAEKGRVRQYRFKFTIKDSQLSVRWLDRGGQERLLIEVPEW